MIDTYVQTIELVKDLGIFAGVYADYPAKVLAKSRAWCIVTLSGNAVQLADENGADVVAMSTYTVDILAPTRTECRTLAGRLCDALAPYKYTRSGMYDAWDESVTGGPRMVLTLRQTADKRGDVFI